MELASHILAKLASLVFRRPRIKLYKESTQMDLKETKLSSESIYQGSFVSINRDKVRLPNGNESQRIVIRHPGAACVLAVTDEGKVVLVRQWRYAADIATIELPAGKLDAGEDPAECALRELAEETPYTTDSVQRDRKSVGRERV